jgi:hypothetical protein
MLPLPDVTIHSVLEMTVGSARGESRFVQRELEPPYVRSYEVATAEEPRTFLPHNWPRSLHRFPLLHRPVLCLLSSLSSSIERNMSLLCLVIVGKDNAPLYQRDFVSSDSSSKDKEEDCFGFASAMQSDTISLRHEVCARDRLYIISFPTLLFLFLLVHDARCVGLRRRLAYC